MIIMVGSIATDSSHCAGAVGKSLLPSLKVGGREGGGMERGKGEGGELGLACAIETL